MVSLFHPLQADLAGLPCQVPVYPLLYTREPVSFLLGYSLSSFHVLIIVFRHGAIAVTTASKPRERVPIIFLPIPQATFVLHFR
jgi:hypothetical protein